MKDITSCSHAADLSTSSDASASGGVGRGYQDLIGDSVTRMLGDMSIRVLGLDALIRSKIEAGRDKDRAVLAILRRTLEESGA